MKNINDKIKDFNKRFKVISNEEYIKEFLKFKTRIINKFQYVDQYIKEASLIEFCDIFGIKRNHIYEENSFIGFTNCKYILTRLENELDEIELYKIIQTIFYLDFEAVHNDKKGEFFESLKGSLSYSYINLEARSSNGEVILYPKGEKLFDDELINKSVDFLNPEAENHFSQALKSYQTKGIKNFIKAAESLRRSLEEFLRFKLKNTKGLDTNIKEIQITLKNDNRDDWIRKIVYGVFSKLDDYFNENSKHQDGDIDEAEIEYLIYQTGVLMRYIDSAIK